MSRCNCDPCNVEPISSNNVKWAAPNLPCTGVLTCDSLTVALQKVDEQICDLKTTVYNLQQEINELKNTTTTTTTTQAPTTTTTTTALPVFYSVSIRVSEEVSTSNNMKIWYSTNGGSTWNYFQTGEAGYPNYDSYVGLSFSSGTNILIGLTDTLDNNLLYGSGQNSGDFVSLCGLLNPYSISSISSNTNVYLNLSVSSSSFVVCP